MKQVSIAQPALLDITNQAGRGTFGANQAWFGSRWQRDSGCGPTAASNILAYHAQRHGRPDICPYITPGQPMTRTAMTQYMHDIWAYVTPGSFGLHDPQDFETGVQAYLRDQGVSCQTSLLRIGPASCSRPSIESAVAFISGALQQDAPVAFLNHSNGSARNLSSWHWVTITALQTDGENVLVTVSDEGWRKQVDFAGWRRTSRLGGALVSVLPDI